MKEGKKTDVKMVLKVTIYSKNVQRFLNVKVNGT